MLLRLMPNLAFNTLEKRYFIAAIAIFIIRAPLEANAACSSAGSITCPCGQTGKSFSALCDVQQPVRNGPCEKFKFCETCLDGFETCFTCPPGRFGPFCEEGAADERLNLLNEVEDVTLDRSKRGVSCPDLKSPKLGSIRCWFSRNEKECTGRCLPGHSFRNNNAAEEIVLTCTHNGWSPLSSFPVCVSEGHCDLEMAGPGGFNCTTGTRGTFCDIHCSGHRWISNRFFCYPGRSWEPPLPYCIRPKNVQPPRVDCKCQNGGTCDVHTEKCKCSEKFEGRFCELYVVTKAFCPNLGHIANGDVMNAEGGVPARGQLHEEGTSVVFTCRNGFALVGHSLLTCTPSGSWSKSSPTCQKIRVPTPTSTTTTAKPKGVCHDPGFIPNGDRWTTEGRASSRRDSFEVGKSVVYSCRHGFALHGLSILTCQSSRQWSNILPECKRTHQPQPSPTTPTTTTTEEDDDDSIEYCEDPGTDPNAIRTEKPWLDAKKKPVENKKDKYPQGFRMKYACKEGYVLKGDDTLLCYFTGVWSGQAPSCEAGPRSSDISALAYCEDPGDIQDGLRIVIFSINQRKKQHFIDADSADPEYPEGTRMEYSCLDDFEMVGQNVLTCTRTGDWSSSTPECL